jgi:hypothetical protein
MPILDFGLQFLFKLFTCFFKLNFFKAQKLIQNPDSKIQNRNGGSEGIQTLSGSLQDFYAVNYITNP